MKILKYLFLLLLLAVVAISVYFGLKDGSYDIPVSKTMQAPPAVVYNEIKNFKNAPDWSAWIQQDTNMQLNYGEKTMGVGAEYSWNSEEMGDGKMVVTNDIPNSKIEYDLHFQLPEDSNPSKAEYIITPTDNGGSEVTYRMYGENNLVQKIVMALFMPNMKEEIRVNNQKTLDNIDAKLSESMSTYEVSVEGIADMREMPYLYVSGSGSYNDPNLSEKMGMIYGQIMAFMQQNNVKMGGQPITVYEKLDVENNSMIYSCGIPTLDKVILADTPLLASGYYPAHKAVKVILKGNYQNLDKAYEAAEAYVVSNNVIKHPTLKMYEMYITDPEATPNPADYITEVFIPVAD